MNNKEEILKESRLKLERRFNDLGIVDTSKIVFGSKIGMEKGLYICGGEHLELWRVKITSHQLTFRPGFDIHEDVIALANEIRKDYYNVI